MVSLIGDPHIRLSQSAFVFLLENLLLQYAFLRVVLFVHIHDIIKSA